MTGTSPRILERERLKSRVRLLCAPFALPILPQSQRCSNFHNTKVLMVYGFSNPHRPDYNNAGRVIRICQTPDHCPDSSKLLTEQPIELAKMLRPILARIQLLAALGAHMKQQILQVSYPWFEMGESPPGIDNGVPHVHQKGCREYTTVYPKALPQAVQRDLHQGFTLPLRTPTVDVRKCHSFLTFEDNGSSVLHLSVAIPSQPQVTSFTISFQMRWYFQNDTAPTRLICTTTNTSFFTLSDFDILTSTFSPTPTSSYELFLPALNKWKVYKNWECRRKVEEGAVYSYRTPGVTSCWGFPRPASQHCAPSKIGHDAVPSTSKALGKSSTSGKRKQKEHDSDGEPIVVEMMCLKKRARVQGSGTKMSPFEISD